MTSAEAFTKVAPRIVNGILTSQFPTAGALLLGSDLDTATLRCSGTLIGCETFLTAAHCVCDGADCQANNAPDPSNFLIFLQHGGFFRASRVAVHPDYSFPKADVAILKLSSAVTGIAPTPLNVTSTPSPGTPGTIVGFGRSAGVGGSSFDSGLKRVGYVTTAACELGLSDQSSVCWNFDDPIGLPSEDSNTCSGDSGGPLFIDFGAGGSVAGVTSGGTRNSPCLPPDHSFDTNVFFYRAWIEEQGGADLHNTSCGALPQVGMTGTESVADIGELDRGHPEGRHTVEVLPGTTQLRVTMNASEEHYSDFDLYVKAGGPPTTSDYDCRAYGRNQYGFCHFDTPVPGTWHVLVNYVMGLGKYQVTATTFGPHEGIRVDASSYQGSNVPANVLDGDKGTRWSAKGDGEWLQFDLGRVTTVHTGSIAWYRGHRRRARFKIEVSPNGQAWTPVVPDGLSSGRTRSLENYPFVAESARYLRIVGYGNTHNAWNSITEVAINR